MGPRRARCADCSATQILLQTELVARRADSTEAIGNALVAKAGRWDTVTVVPTSSGGQ